MRSWLRPVVVCAVAAALPVLSVRAAEGPKPSDTPSAAPTAYGGRVYQLKHRRPRSVVDILQPLRSGSPGTEIAASDELWSISVRDFPENLAAIGEAIVRLDTDSGPAADVELRVYVLLASETGPSTDVPAEIAPVVASARSGKHSANLALVAPIVQRTRIGTTDGFGGQGSAGGPGMGNATYSYGAESLLRSTTSNGTARVDLRRFRFDINGSGELGSAKISSDLSLELGKPVVAASATLAQGRSLLVVVSAVAVN